MTRYRATITYRRFGQTTVTEPACEHRHKDDRQAARCASIRLRAILLRDRPAECGYRVERAPS